jgi:hypothetical protein
MASENSKRMQRGLAPALKARGFAKTGATWRKQNDETVRVFNIQGSAWGPHFYVNLGIYFRALGDRDRPRENHCHIRTRLSELVPDRSRLNALLDFETAFDKDARIQEVVAHVVEFGLPWLDALSTIEGACERCAFRKSDSHWITEEAKGFLQNQGVS